MSCQVRERGGKRVSIRFSATPFHVEGRKRQEGGDQDKGAKPRRIVQRRIFVFFYCRHGGVEVVVADVGGDAHHDLILGGKSSSL
jgi:hypothetical protein